jgi:DNA-binding NtrC family response regulator
LVESSGLISKLSVLIAVSDAEEAKQIENAIKNETDLIIEDTINDGFLLSEKVKIVIPDIIIIDYHLKNIDVLEFVEEAVIRYPTTATIIIVNEEDLVDLRKFVSVRNVIARPLKFNELPRLIRNSFVSTIKKRKLLSSSFKPDFTNYLTVCI